MDANMNANTSFGPPAESKTMKTVYTIVERGPGKSYWTKIGVGFTNRDGSINLKLDAIPVNGSIQVRDYEPYERRSPQDRPDAADPLGPRARAFGNGRDGGRDSGRDIAPDALV